MNEDSFPAASQSAEPPEPRHKSPPPPADRGDGVVHPTCSSTPNVTHRNHEPPENSVCVLKLDDSATGDAGEDSAVHGMSVNDDISVGHLTKDDSGISIEKSVGKESSCAGDDTVERATSDCTGGGRDGAPSAERPSVSNESSGVVANIGNPEDSDGEAAANCSSDVMAVEGGDANSNPSSDEDGQSAEEAEEAHADDRDEVGQARKRRIRLRHLSTSSSSPMTSGPDDVDDVEMNDDDDDDGSEEDADADAPVSKIKDTWHPLFELRHRELGMGNRRNDAHVFRAKTAASVNLVQRLKRHKTMEHHDGCVNALHFNQSGTLLASGSDDLNIVVWNWMEGKPYFVFDSGHRSNVFQSKFMPYTGDTHIVSCARDGQVRLAELSSTGVCKGTRKLAQHRGGAHKLSLLQDSSHVFYCCGEDAVAFEIDLRQEKPNKMCICKEGERKVALYSIHANPFKSHEFCVGGRDHFIRVYDKRKIDESEGPLKKFCPHHLLNSDIKANVTCAVYNYNGEEIIGTYNDEDIYMFDANHSDGAEYIHKYSGHRNNATVKGVNFYGPKSEFVVSGSDCGNVFLWEKSTEEIVQYFHGDDGGVINVLEPHPHCPILATSGLDHDVKVWMPTATENTKLDGLKRTVRRNKRDRDEERTHEPDMADGQMLWILMQQLRRSARRRNRDADEDLPRLGSSDSDEESDDDSDGPGGEQMQCVPS